MNRRQFLKTASGIILCTGMSGRALAGIIQGRRDGGLAACTGTTSIGPSTDPPSANYASGASALICQRLTMPSSCDRVATNIHVLQKYGDDTNHRIELAFYADNGSGTDPGDFIASYGSFYTVGSGSVYIYDPDPEGFSQQLSNTDTYVWPAVMLQAAGQRVGYDAGSGEARRYASTWGVWPDPWPTGSDTATSNRDYGFQITWGS